MRQLVIILSLLALVGCVSGHTSRSYTKLTSEVIAANAGLKTDFSIDDLLGLKEIGGPEKGAYSLSPDKQWLAFRIVQAEVDRNAYRSSWHLLRITDPQELKLIHTDEEQIFDEAAGGGQIGTLSTIAPQWSPDSKFVAFRSKSSGEVQIWEHDIVRQKTYQLTHNAADIIDFRFDGTGDNIHFRVGHDRKSVRETDEEEGARGYLFTQSFTPYYADKPIWGACTGSPLWQKSNDVKRLCNPVSWVINRRTGKEHISTYANLPPTAGELLVAKLNKEGRPATMAAQAKDNVAIIWAENATPGIGPYWLRDYQLFYSETGEVADTQACRETECRGAIAEIIPTEDSDEFFLLRQQGVSKSEVAIYAYSIRTGELRKILHFEDLLYGCVNGGGGLICLHEGPVRPRRLVWIDKEKGEVRQLYDPNEQLGSRSFPAIEKMEYEDAFGNRTYGHLVYPTNYSYGRRYPLAIVQYSSRGFLKGGTGNEYPIIPLANSGFFVLRAEQPLDWNYDGPTLSLLENDRREWRNLYRTRRAVTALENAINKLADRGMVDLARVGITGLSSGATTLYQSLIETDLYAAAAVSGGSWAESLYYLTGISVWHDYMKNVGLGAPRHEDNGLWAEFSLPANAHRIGAPVLINVADRELRGSADEVFVSLYEAGVPVEMYVFPDEYHIKWQPIHRYNIYRRNIQWLKFWLQDEEVDDPVDPDQYARWRKMREDHCANMKAEEEEYLPVYCDAA